MKTRITVFLCSIVYPVFFVLSPVPAYAVALAPESAKPANGVVPNPPPLFEIPSDTAPNISRNITDEGTADTNAQEQSDEVAALEANGSAVEEAEGRSLANGRPVSSSVRTGVVLIVIGLAVAAIGSLVWNRLRKRS